ncbi:DUF4333 domain-containing protein [Blastococcus sp. LR1]|uniref:DUF4333 domain-containing protein n=1 Tax=Blastococcus sp. LR1 TaxID=2877000 RepID=UPI001CCC1D25|nr:DUF4333 domain-containing protein [Blastococcus sp. LR1]MCA0145547.1 DUF4333 domain-containing protein [Blastococcus sp. LR1]
MTTVPRRPRTGVLWALAAVLFGGVVGCSLLVQSLEVDPLDPEVVERDIAAEYEERRNVALDLDCPRDMPVASGEGYSCRGVTAEGEQISVWIQIDDRLDGSYTWGE